MSSPRVVRPRRVRRITRQSVTVRIDGADDLRNSKTNQSTLQSDDHPLPGSLHGKDRTRLKPRLTISAKRFTRRASFMQGIGGHQGRGYPVASAPEV